MDVDVAAPTTLLRRADGRLPLPFSPSRPRPQIPIRDYLVRPSSPSVPRTEIRVAAPQSTGAMSFATASLMPEPPGQMRRDGLGEVGRGGSGDGREVDIEWGRRREAIAVDADVAVLGRVEGDQDSGRRTDSDGDSKVPAGAVRAGTSGGDTTRRARERHDGSSVEKAVLIDEGYGSFSFAADASANETPPGLGLREDRRHHIPFDHLFEDHVEAGKSGVLRTQDGGARKAVSENAAEDAAMEEVNALFRSRLSRAPDGRAEGRTVQVADRDAHRDKEPVMLDDGARGLLDVVKKEAEESMRTLSGAGGEGGGKSTLVLPRWQGEVDARKRGAIERARSARGSDWKEDLRLTASRNEADGIRMGSKDDPEQLRLVQERLFADLASRSKEERERSRSARASDGKDEVRPKASHREADGVRVNPKDDSEQLRLAQERLIADLASRTKAKREREEVRLRKEQEANRQASLVRETRNAQIATAANQERTRKNARPAKNEEAPMAAEARTIPARREGEGRERMDVATEAKRKKEAEKLASLRKKAAEEAVRRIVRNKIDEEKRAKAAKIAGPPLVRIKVEDSSSDDAVRSGLARERGARQAAAERSRSRQAQNGAGERPELVEERSSKTSDSGQASVALGLSSSGDEALVGNRTPSAHSSALDSQLHRANENLQAALAEKMILEAEAEARRVQAECTALKRRAEEADAQDGIDRSLHKKARSIDQSVRNSQSTLGSNPSSVEDMSSPHDAEVQAQGRRPTKTSEERMSRKRESNKRWRLKKLAERKLLQAQSQQVGVQDYIVGRQSKSSPTESEDNDGAESRQKQPMGLRALCTPDLISHAQGLQDDNDTARSGGLSKPFVPKDHDERPTSNGNMKTAQPRRDDKAKSHVMRDRAAKDEYYNNLKATLATFQQPQSSLGPEPEQTSTPETFTAGTPVHQESEESISSDEDEDENQAVKPTSSFGLSALQKTPDIPEKSQPPPPRPTYARKTLPTQLRKTASEEADNADTHVSEDEANATATTTPPDRASPPPELLWAYNITRKEYLNDEDPTTVPHTTDGPYWSLAQANAIAATDVHRERGAVRILAPMEFTLTIDALGMRTHSICSNGGTITTAVERVLVPPSRARGPMADKAWLPRRMFVVLEREARRGDGNEKVPRARAVRTRGLFTVLDLANREASRWVLERQAAKLGDCQLDQVIRAEKVMRAREHLERLDRDGKTFESSCVVEDGGGGGVVEVWVEECPVVGPRN